MRNADTTLILEARQILIICLLIYCNEVILNVHLQVILNVHLLLSKLKKYIQAVENSIFH